MFQLFGKSSQAQPKKNEEEIPSTGCCETCPFITYRGWNWSLNWLSSGYAPTRTPSYWWIWSTLCPRWRARVCEHHSMTYMKSCRNNHAINSNPCICLTSYMERSHQNMLFQTNTVWSHIIFLANFRWLSLMGCYDSPHTCRNLAHPSTAWHSKHSTAPLIQSGTSSSNVTTDYYSTRVAMKDSSGQMSRWLTSLQYWVLSWVHISRLPWVPQAETTRMSVEQQGFYSLT